MSDAGEEPRSPSAITAAPSIASGIAIFTASGGSSRRKSRDSTIAKSGAVLTSSTEAATDVCERLAIQVAKWSASATPEAASNRRARGPSVGHERRAPAAANGASSSAAIVMR